MMRGLYTSASLDRRSARAKLAAMSASEMNAVLAGIEAAVRGGVLPVVVFDLDSTLFCTGERNLRILRDFTAASGAEFSGLGAAVETLGPADMGWNVNDALKARGLDDAALHGRLKRYWSERFFTNEFVLLDEPIAGAPQFAQACRKNGALLYYLTGRHVGGMEQGTTASLLRHGFPLLAGHAILHLKPAFEVPDHEFKKQAMAGIAAMRGEVVATFENEPGNANLFLRTFPTARHFLLLTVHSPDAEAPDKRLIRLRSFHG